MKVLILWHWYILHSLLWILCLSHLSNAQLRVESIFDQRGVSGNIVFSQDSPDDNTTITVNLTGLGTTSLLWHVHKFPFPHDGQPNPCRDNVTGGVYNPLQANNNDCTSEPAQCKLGDLSGRLGALNGSNLQYSGLLCLYGVHTIIGRSLVLQFTNKTYFVCANIGYPTSQPNGNDDQVDILYAPFRNNFTGDIYFRQYTSNLIAAVFVNLASIDALMNSSGHDWYVQLAGYAVNSRGVNASSDQYNNSTCNNMNQSNCEVGNLSCKSSPFRFVDGMIKQFYTDTNLPLKSIANGSVVINEANMGEQSIASANISQYLPLEAEAVFTERVNGTIRFLQISPFDRTRVDIQLSGLEGIAGEYHIQEYPIGSDSKSFPMRCDEMYVGPQWNPLNVPRNTEKPPATSDEYAIGDLSGKFGSLENMSNVSQTHYDPNIPLYGLFGIIGRSVVVRSSNMTPWVCANILYTRPVLQVTYFINTSNIVGQVTLTQPANDPFAATTIIVELEILGELEPLPQFTSSASIASVVSTSLSSFLSPTPTRLSLTPTPTHLSLILTPVSSTLEVQATQLLSPTPVSTQSTLASTPVSTQSSLASTPVSTQSTLTSTPVSTQSTLTSTPVLSTLILSPSPPSSFSPNAPASASSSLEPVNSFELSLTSFSVSQITSADTSGLLPSTRTAMFVTSPSLPLSTSELMTPSSTPLRRRRSSDIRSKRQAMENVLPFDWNFRSGMVENDPSSCQSLPVLGQFPSNDNLCSVDAPLSCAMGDLTSKHGPLNFPLTGGLFRVVFTDPNLPLSGPDSNFSNASSPALFIQPMNGGTMQNDNLILCNSTAVITLLSPTTQPTTPPTTTPPTMTQTTPPTMTQTTPPTMTQTTPPLIGTNSGGLPVIAIVGGVAGGIVAVVLIIVVVGLILCFLKKRNISKYEVKKMEMGTAKPTKPILGVPNYKVLHQYNPQSEDDLALMPGDWVTLEETPYGGGWWKGTIEERGTGWFPKTYVYYVDREAEKKKKKDESFKLAAAAIMDASSSFSARQSVLSTGQDYDMPLEYVSGGKRGKKVNRKHTINKTEIDSTPKSVTKFDKPYLERDDIVGLMVIENKGKNSSGGSCPDTPKSITNNEIIENVQAMDSGASQEDDDDDDFTMVKALLEEEELNLLPHAEKHVTKYDFVGTTVIELEFQKGSVIKVIEKADNGWWKGVYKGQVGWFPESYVDPIPLTTKKRSDVTRNEVIKERTGSTADAEVERPRNMDETMAAGGDLEALEYRAVYSYQSDTVGDLTFNEEDTILVYWAQDNGWWFGAIGSRQGWFPESYVEPIIDVSTSEAKAAEEIVDKIKNKEEASTLSKQEVSKNEDDGLVNQLISARTQLKSPSEQEVSKNEDDGLVNQLISARTQLKSSSESREMDVIQEEPKNEDPVSIKKEKGIEDELSVALTKKEPVSIDKHTLITSKAEPKSDGSGLVAADSQKELPSALKEKKKTSPIEKKPKPITEISKSRRQTAPAKAHRRAPPPPPSSLKVTFPPVIAEEPKPAPQATPLTPNTIAVSRSSEKSENKELLKSKESPSSPALATNDVTISLTGPHGSEHAATKLAKPVSKPSDRQLPNRRTTAIDIQNKPRRRPPPPVPQALLEAAGASTGKTSSKLVELSEKSKPQNDAGKSETPNIIPVPLPRVKARMKKVKRPTSRMIPPPPSIPLPPPPIKRISLLKNTLKMAESNDYVPAPTLRVPDENEPPLTPRGTPKGPRPPPPKRISSLSVPSKPVPAVRSGGPPNKDKSVTTNPPKRPPPPRPASAVVSNDVTSKSCKPNRPPLAAIMKTSEPETGKPNRPPLAAIMKTSEPETVQSESSIHPRGSRLMNSLKRMVKRGGSIKEDVKEDAESSSKPQDPHSPKQVDNDNQMVLQPLSSENDPPMPKPRLKKQSSLSGLSEGDKQLSTSQTSSSLLAGSTTSQVNGPKDTNSSQAKQQPPSRPSHPPNVSHEITQSPETSKPTSAQSTQSSKSVPGENIQPSKPVLGENIQPSKPASAQNTQPIKPEKIQPIKPVPRENNIQPSKPALGENIQPSKPASAQNTQPSKPVPRENNIQPNKQVPVEDTQPSVGLPPIRKKSSVSSNEGNSSISQAEYHQSGKVPPKSKPPLAPKPSLASLTKKQSFIGPLKTPDMETTKSNSTTAIEQMPSETFSNGCQSSPKSPTNFYRATMKYTGKSDDELSFSVGDTLLFIEKREGGFYYGMLDNGTTGLFPLDHVEPFLAKFL